MQRVRGHLIEGRANPANVSTKLQFLWRIGGRSPDISGMDSRRLWFRLWKWFRVRDHFRSCPSS